MSCRMSESTVSVSVHSVKIRRLVWRWRAAVVGRCRNCLQMQILHVESRRGDFEHELLKAVLP
jgi:hypothetical protein